jgi:SAM-dependent methyltransferase
MPKFDPYFLFWYRAVKRLGFGHAAWTLRKLALPVGKDDLVLEVGAGDHPFPRSDILVDKYEDSAEQERWGSLPLDRPTFIFEGENLPFRDQAFDFVIAVQVLEHSSDPGRFLQELQRVGKGGYIEVPEAIWERLAPMPFHVSEITERDGTLMIKKKHTWSEDEELEELWKRKLMWTKPVRELTRKNPDLLNVRYFWFLLTSRG